MSQLTSSTPKTSLEILNSANNGVRIEFRWAEDRIAHSLFGVCNGETGLLLESIEGHADDLAAPSPALVELHQQEEMIFLTGACSVGHWSMAVEPIRVEEMVGLKFDIACRVKSPVERLTSSYRIADSLNTKLSETQLNLCSSIGEYRLESLKLTDDDQLSCNIAQCDSKMQLMRKLSQDASPQTARWQYQVFK